MRQPALVLLTLALLALTSCGPMQSPAVNVQYYTLEAPTSPGSPPPLAIGTPSAVLAVNRFTSAPELLTDKMIYRDAAYQRGTYSTHRWMAMPSDLTTSFLTRHLQTSACCRAVLPPGDGSAGTHTLSGSLLEFQEEDTPDGGQAVLSISVIVKAENEPDIARAVLLHKEYNARRPCQSRHPQAVAKAMSEAMALLSTEVAADLRRVLGQ